MLPRARPLERLLHEMPARTRHRRLLMTAVLRVRQALATQGAERSEVEHHRQAHVRAHVQENGEDLERMGPMRPSVGPVAEEAEAPLSLSLRSVVGEVAEGEARLTKRRRSSALAEAAEAERRRTLRKSRGHVAGAAAEVDLERVGGGGQ
mmetsp:Transcript_71938/g.127943  ORF Transcript_71938/g.127943 Transcript_71938/m.127943 type:complete len:150 (+) Transcript_71938:322-771(+)